jgi:hypothetical protein
MNILSLLTNHYHYWGIPHERPRDKRMVQTCYECGAERELKVELRQLWVRSDANALEGCRNSDLRESRP